MQGFDVVSNRSLSLLSAAGALAVLPLAFVGGPEVPVESAAATMVPYTVEVRVVTATRVLNLATLTQSDFGDGDAHR